MMSMPIPMLQGCLVPFASFELNSWAWPGLLQAGPRGKFVRTPHCHLIPTWTKGGIPASLLGCLSSGLWAPQVSPATWQKARFSPNMCRVRTKDLINRQAACPWKGPQHPSLCTVRFRQGISTAPVLSPRTCFSSGLVFPQ